MKTGKYVNVRLTPEDYKTIAAEAREKEQAPGTLCRTVLAGYAKRRRAALITRQRALEAQEQAAAPAEPEAPLEPAQAPII